ncbi:MAG TPA: hypothetical protein VFA41_12520 [Ktedonobacteraceae bacterium]|jgi:enoyl-CoA hydratase/carnithine racemase|nr:hypothetical protein [Ktedonobacteraceae bacterium]
MQQAYHTLRVVSEAETVRIVLSTSPDTHMLLELVAACATLSTARGIKAVVLDFRQLRVSYSAGATPSPAEIEKATKAIYIITQPVLAVIRDTLAPDACKLLSAADMTLTADEATLTLSTGENETETLKGSYAARLGYITWSTQTANLDREMERILHMLREKSAIALQIAKASVRLGASEQGTRLEALQRINALYLKETMVTKDAPEGLRAFLEKRKPTWNNL